MGWSERRAQRGRKAGFTLFEALVVITIIGVVSALSAPAIHGAIVERKVQRAALDLVRVARRARSEALYTGRAHVLYVVGTGRGSATIFRGRMPRCNANDWTAIVGDGTCEAGNINCVDQLDLNEARFAMGSSTISMTSDTTAAPLQVCFEPFGATRYRSGASVAANAAFTDQNTSAVGGAFAFGFQRYDSGTAQGPARHVLIPLGGDARIVR